MKKVTFDIKGMHCKSCELLIEDAIRKLPGVKSAHASTKKSNVVIVAGDDFDNRKAVEAIESLDYSVGKADLPFITKEPEDIKNLLSAVIFFVALYVLAKTFNLDSLLRSAGNNASLPVVFTLGITAGFSTCMAIVGGLVLGISTRHREKHPEATPLQNFRPHLYFNLGRIVSYVLLGGFIGAIGGALKIPTVGLGYITVFVGIYLLFLGLQIIDIFPRLSALPTMPKFVTKALKIDSRNGEYSHKNSFILGGLTFFLPCGFTQAMQLYAISTGSFISGALIMGAFALGTAPGLLGIGGLVSYVKKGYFSKIFFKFVGVMVIGLSLYNVSTGMNLAGINLSLPAASEEGPVTEENDDFNKTGIQLLEAKYTAEDGKIKPDRFKVKKDKPVRLEVYAEDDGFGCMGSIMIPGVVNEPQFFEKGKKAILEFTPKRLGTYRITCAMGVPSGVITVE